MLLDFDLFGIYSLELTDEKELKEYKLLNSHRIKTSCQQKI